MKKIILGSVVVLFAAISFGVHAEEETYKHATPEYGHKSRLVEHTATVKGVNQKTREVTLENENGEITTVEVGDSVKNFKKLKKGDQVSIKYYEALAWSLIEKKYKEKPTKSTTEATTTAEPGEKPSGQKTRQIHLIATIEKIDKKAPSVTLKGPEGNSVTVIVEDRKNLKKAKVGDQVEVTYTEALAISVEKAAKK